METMVMECIKLVKTDCLQPRGISVHFFCVSAGQTYTYVADPVDGLRRFATQAENKPWAPCTCNTGYRLESRWWPARLTSGIPWSRKQKYAMSYDALTPKKLLTFC